MRLGSLLICAGLALLFSTGCFKRDKLTPADIFLIEGDKLFFAGDFKGAESSYKSALAYGSENPRVLSRLGRLAYRQGRTLSGFFLLQGTIYNMPEDTDLLLTYGLASHALARSTEARTAAKRVLEKDPTNEEALILLVETGITSRDSLDARRIIEQARAKQKDAAAYHVAFGMLHLLLREEKQAESEFRQALELDPKSAAAHSQMGALLLRRGDTEGGMAAIRQAADLSPLRSPRRINYIERLIQTEAHAEAERELAKITEKAPDYVPAWMQLMKLSFKQGKYDESAAAADKVLDSDRANYDAWMQRVAIKLRRNDLESVISDLQKVADFFNKSPEVKYQLALVLLQKGEIISAEQQLQQALRMAPNYDEALLLQAEIELRKGNTSAAAVGLRQFLKRRPNSTQGQILLAQVHQADGEPMQALSVLQTMAEAFPKHPEAHYLVGLSLLKLDRGKEARATFEQALAISEKYWPALEMLIELDLIEKQAATTTARIEAMLQKYPETAPLWLLRAKVRVVLNDINGAESDLTKAIALDPTNSYPYLLLSRIYLQLERMQESLDKLTTLVGQQPSANIWMQLGMLHGMLKNYPEARTSYEKALALDSRFAPALNNLALLQLEHFGNIEKAEELIKRAREYAPQDPLVADTAGWILVRRGQYEVALRLLQTAAVRLPGDPEVTYHVGMAQYYLGQEDSARQSFKSVMTASTNAPVKLDAAARLAILDIDPGQATPALRSQLENVVRTDPNDPIALLRLAAIGIRHGRLPEAAGHYEAALKIYPRNTAAMLALAELYFGPLQKLERAKELAKQARDAAPNDDQIAWKLGRLLYTAGEFVWANGLLLDAALGITDNSEILFDVALSQYSIGRVPETAAALEKILTLVPPPANRSPAARMVALLTAAKQTPPDGNALAEARRILAEDPKYVPALMLTAVALEAEKKPEEAYQSYERVLSVYPQFVPAMRQLAILSGEQLADDAKTEEWSRKTLKLLPDDPDANFQIGVVSYRRGNYEEAVRFLNQCIRHRNDSASAYFFLGMSYFQLKNGSECGVALKRALQLKLPPQEANEAMRILDALARRRGNL